MCKDFDTETNIIILVFILVLILYFGTGIKTGTDICIVLYLSRFFHRPRSQEVISEVHVSIE